MNYLISTIQYNGVVNKTLLRNMMLFADNHKVDKILLYVMPGKNVDEQMTPDFGDDRIELLFLGKEGQKLNNNLKLHDTRILASQINPLTGFQTKLSNKHSYILPSPKIRFLSLPNTSKHPRFLATTGALTHGNYKDGSSGASNTAQGRKAMLEHQYGFAFVEVKNNRVFDFHPVEALKNGNFNYLREAYKNGKVSDEQPACLSIGDWHTGDTCPKTREATIIMLEQLAPKFAVWHDIFDSKSINHHEQSDCLSRAQLCQTSKNDLKVEIENCRQELNYFAERFPDIVFLVAESNHDLFLRKYVGNPAWATDGQNLFFTSRVVGELEFKAEQPILQTALELLGDVAENIRFLSEDEEMRIGGTLISAHGHNGINGSRGSGQSFSNYNLKQITGHSHTPALFANGMVIGTSTYLKLSYTKGPSSWMNGHGLLYNSGKYTLLLIIH